MPVDPLPHHGAHRMERRYWTLDENSNPVKVRNAVEWARGFDEDKRRVASSEIADVRVSTHGRPLDRRPL